MLSSSNQRNQSIIIVLNSLFIVLFERAPVLEIKENRKLDKKNHLKSSPLKLTWPIGTRL
jgi:hypothetical protein